MAVVAIGPTARLDPPDDLVGRELEFWHEIVASVAPDHFRPCDRPLLAAYCQQMVVYRDAYDALRRAGSAHVAKNGYEGVSPAFSVVERSAKLMASLARVLRLSPSSRSVKFAERTTRAVAKPWQFSAAQ